MSYRDRDTLQETAWARILTELANSLQGKDGCKAGNLIFTCQTNVYNGLIWTKPLFKVSSIIHPRKDGWKLAFTQ